VIIVLIHFRGKFSFRTCVAFVWKKVLPLTDGKSPNSVLFGENVALHFITKN
jgi:hypothetical protein